MIQLIFNCRNFLKALFTTSRKLYFKPPKPPSEFGIESFNKQIEKIPFEGEINFR